eukprot:CAMPEP_0119105110 /NCGR_PEP_ID=MMETSP1180-20130426/3169_1 /TAXON_ID=3052 ORGANISM="Chlamydomonas cf sp, Strain CCMP681" /NCGR_SAMPLE_ID=MMETSP1180 /ASSEMBLY_ACC=CAM_ASM_000741 /LENGTH=68 /DNA_ID=CAMNT_0007090087 /DNA_START=45 /DNA_END=251 /DNA_ORIENTATION=-
MTSPVAGASLAEAIAGLADAPAAQLKQGITLLLEHLEIGSPSHAQAQWLHSLTVATSGAGEKAGVVAE